MHCLLLGENWNSTELQQMHTFLYVKGVHCPAHSLQSAQHRANPIQCFPLQPISQSLPRA